MFSYSRHRYLLLYIVSSHYTHCNNADVFKMDFLNPASFNHRTERLATGRTYHFVDQVPPGYNPLKTPTLLCVHGFPDLWSVSLVVWWC